MKNWTIKFAIIFGMLFGWKAQADYSRDIFIDYSVKLEKKDLSTKLKSFVPKNPLLQSIPNKGSGYYYVYGENEQKCDSIKLGLSLENKKNEEIELFSDCKKHVYIQTVKKNGKAMADTMKIPKGALDPLQWMYLLSKKYKSENKFNLEFYTKTANKVSVRKKPTEDKSILALVNNENVNNKNELQLGSEYKIEPIDRRTIILKIAGITLYTGTYKNLGFPLAIKLGIDDGSAIPYDIQYKVFPEKIRINEKYEKNFGEELKN